MTTERQLRCPACDGPMQSVERRGVVIDICRDCKGVYLDRGELDKILDEAARQDATLVGSTPPQEPSPLADEADRLGGRRERRYDDDDDDYDERDEHWGRGRRRRKGWLDDIFDFG